MKYFTQDIWQEMSSSDETVRLQAETKWELRLQQYNQVFDITRKHLPIRFLREYEKCNEFHDYVIKRIMFTTSRGEFLCQLELGNGIRELELSFVGLKAFKVTAESFDSCICGELRWGYSEIEWTQNKTLRFEILCDYEIEMCFECKMVKITKV